MTRNLKPSPDQASIQWTFSFCSEMKEATPNPCGEGEIEQISHEDDDEDAWVCLCGNMPPTDGFATCNDHGDEIEPDIGSDWNDLYVCNRCGRIINSTNLMVVGRKTA